MSNGAAIALTLCAAAALLVTAAWNRGQIEQALQLQDAPDAPPVSDWLDEVAAAVAETKNAIMPTPASTMTTSAEGLAHLQAREGLRLVRYRLGDGGYTIGFGRYFPDGGPIPPDTIDRATAEAWFVQDVAQKGERWVRAYVTVPLLQHEFDALVSMAFNLRPASFKTIADAVNRGEDPEAAAMVFTRPGTNLERGLVNRRVAELAIFRAGDYA